VSLEITKDSMRDVLQSIQHMVGQKVLIGVPAKTADREGPINNAGILYLMENGSPANNLPARPTLVPGVEAALPACTKLMKKGASAALDGHMAKAMTMLDEAGQKGRDGVKAMFSSNVPPPLSPSTIRSRKYARTAKGEKAHARANETAYLSQVKGGMDPAAAQNASGIVALMNTGELRNSISYEVRKAK
jgi:hypothetical protein